MSYVVELNVAMEIIPQILKPLIRDVRSLEINNYATNQFLQLRQVTELLYVSGVARKEKATRLRSQHRSVLKIHSIIDTK